MTLSVQQLVLVTLLAIVGVASAIDTYYEPDNSDSHECGLGEDNRLPYPYALHAKPPGSAMGECADSGFVIVEKRHHYCIPGKSVIKVLRRKPTCNCKGQPPRCEYYGSESKVMPSYTAPTAGVQGPSPVTEEQLTTSDQVSRMLRTLISDRGNYGETVENVDLPQYRTLEANGASRMYNNNNNNNNNN